MTYFAQPCREYGHPVGTNICNHADTYELEFQLCNETIARFLIPVDFVEEHIDACPRPHPFEVLEALDFFLPHKGKERDEYDLLADAYGSRKPEIMLAHFRAELCRFQEHRNRFHQRLLEIAHKQIDARVDQALWRDKAAAAHGTTTA